MASSYQELIIAATGCSVEDAAETEDVMRGVNFCSTLDWQTRDELVNGARLAQSVIRHMRAQDTGGPR